MIGCTPILFAGLLFASPDPQDVPKHADLGAVGDRIESCLRQLGVADKVFAECLANEARLAAADRDVQFWSNAGVLRIPRAYASFQRGLEPGRTLLSLRKNIACASDAALLDQICTNELPLLAAAVADVLPNVESATEWTKAATVSDAEKPIRERVASTGGTVVKELETLRDSIRQAMRDAPIPEVKPQLAKNTTPNEEPLPLSETIDRASQELAAIDTRIADLCKEFQSEHFSDFTNPFTNSGGPFRLGTFEPVRKDLRPLVVLSSSRSAFSCDADRVLIAPAVSAELQRASSMLDGHVDAQRRARGVLAALELHDEEASLRDRTLKAGDDAIAELEQLREKIRTELHSSASAK